VWSSEFTTKAAALQPSPQKFENFAKRFEALVVVYVPVLRALPPAALPPSPAAPARGMTRRVLYTAAFFLNIHDGFPTGLSVSEFVVPSPG
jgi:hypothetical protein